MKIETFEYESSHGKAPKGEGCWGFLLYCGTPNPELVFVPGIMTLTKAKKWLRANVGLKGVHGIQVAP
jgi:hypothetical protein